MRSAVFYHGGLSHYSLNCQATIPLTPSSPPPPPHATERERGKGGKKRERKTEGGRKRKREREKGGEKERNRERGGGYVMVKKEESVEGEGEIGQRQT